MNKTPLCYAPFIGMYASSYNSYAPCCVSKKFKATSPKQYWAGDQLKQVRTDLLNNKWPSSCSYCKNKLDNNLKNDIDIWDKDFNSFPVNINIETGNQTNGPLYIDYRPSNVCNLKCRMCVPQASNQIEKEVYNNPELLEWFSVPDNKVDNFYNFLHYVKNLQLRKIKILGGEPTIDSKTIKFLQSISDILPTPILRFTTNATNLNQKFKQILAAFDDIQVSFSVDGTDKTYEYIRTNANWLKTKKNIEKFFKDNIASQYGFNIVLTPYNIFNLVDLLDWFYVLYKKGYKFHLYFDDSDISHNGISAILPNHKEQVVEDIFLWKLSHQEIDRIDGFNQLEKLLETTPFNQANHNMFKKYNNVLDNIRKTSLLELDSRFESYI